MTKAKQYGWVKTGDHGKACIIPIADINIDRSYQRGSLTNVKTLRIASNFNWIAFGSLVIMERTNGKLFVVDGQQRLFAASRRGDINKVPCIIFKSDGRDHEARAFLSLNVDRTPVSSFNKFSASVKAALNPEYEIATWLKTQGLYVTSAGKYERGIGFPTVLVQLWKQDDDASKRVIIIQREINGSKPLHGIGHRGLWWLQHKKIDVSAYADIIKRCGGSIAIQRSIKTIELETGLKASVRTCGLGVLSLINSKLHNRINISEAK